MSLSRYRVILGRAWRLRCPRCGQTRLFRGWFKMHTECAHCGLKYEREPGFFLGSVYINYGLTALVMTIFYVSMMLTDTLPQETLLAISLAFCLLFPLLFFRYARSLWLGFDQYWDPQGRTEAEQDQ